MAFFVAVCPGFISGVNWIVPYVKAVRPNQPFYSPSLRSSFPVPLRVGGWVALRTRLATFSLSNDPSKIRSAT